MIKVFFARVLEFAINAILALDPNHTRFLQRHQGKVLKLNITDLNQAFYFVLREHRVYLFSTYTNEPDTLIQGSSFSLLKQTMPNNDINTLLIEGDSDLAHDLQMLIQGIDLHWEEFFSFIAGDFTTDRVTHFLKQLKKHTAHAKQRTVEDLRQYLQEEKRFVPTREEVEDLYEDIASLRQTLDRLEARIGRLRESTP